MKPQRQRIGCTCFFSLIALITIIVIYCVISSKQMKQSKEHLTNGVAFEGYITDIKQSDNHAFGIIQLQLDKTNTSKFDKTLKGGIYPYRIKGNVAELYCTIIFIKKGDVVKVISDIQKAYFNSQESMEQQGIYIITNSYDINFVKENTIFK